MQKYKISLSPSSRRTLHFHNKDNSFSFTLSPSYPDSIWIEDYFFLSANKVQHLIKTNQITVEYEEREQKKPIKRTRTKKSKIKDSTNTTTDGEAGSDQGRSDES